MKKILVPTDFSVNSKTGIRFAMQWSRQEKVELIFINILNLVRLTKWTDSYIRKLIKEETEFTRTKLEKFVRDIYKSIGITPGKYSCVIKDGTSAYNEIMVYCRKEPVDFICISTRGAGKIKKILGTNTGNLITKSTVPVVAIPQNYKARTITRVLYASDFSNYTEELKKVMNFARPLNASVEILHFAWPDEALFDQETFEKIIRRQFRCDVKLHIKKTDGSHTFVYNLQNQVRISKPSVVIMFTEQKRTIFQKIFLSSKAEQLSFQTKVPLLVFNKEHRHSTTTKRKLSKAIAQ